MKRFEITYVDRPNGAIFPVVSVVYATKEKKAVKILVDDFGAIEIQNVREVKEPVTNDVA
jgi:hypothetical protein